MDILLRIRSFIERIALGITVVLLSLLATLIAVQVLLRSLNIGINWTEEFARFSYVGVTFLGSALAVIKGKHISITFLAELMPLFVQRVLSVLIHLAMAVFMIVCTYGTLLLMDASQGVGSNSMLWFKMNYIYTGVLISCILMIFVSILRALEFALNREIPGTGEKEADAI